MLLDSHKKNRLLEFEDIVKELSKEKNIPYEEIEEICKLSLEYTKKLTEDKNTLSILFPELGTLYYSERFGEFYKIRVQNFTGHNIEKKKELHEFYTYRTNLIKTGEKLNEKKSYHRRKPFLYKFKNIYKKLFDGKIVKGGATLGYQELWSKFSEIQNNIQNE